MHDSSVPVNSLMDRNHLQSELGDAVERMSKFLSFDVDVGAQIITWITELGELNTRDTVLLLLFRQGIELLDSSSILVQHRIDKPVLLMARTQFELSLSMKYILKTDSKLRARQYSYYRLRNDLNEAERVVGLVDSGDYSGRDRIKDTYKELYPTANAKISELRERIDKVYPDIDSEYERSISQGGNKYPTWYSLFGGPRSVYRLAEHLGYLDYYNDIYGHLSKLAHGSTALTGLRAAGELGSIDGFRNGLDLVFAVTMTHTMYLMSFSDITEQLLPHKSKTLASWYINHVRPEFQWLQSVNITVPE